MAGIEQHLATLEQRIRRLEQIVEQQLGKASAVAPGASPTPASSPAPAVAVPAGLRGAASAPRPPSAARPGRPPMAATQILGLSGAAALVLTDLETALARDKAIVFRAAEQVNDFLPLSRRDITLFEGCEMAWKKAFASSGLSLEDLSLVETHDCFTIAELLEYEAMGLAERGQGAEVIAEGVSAKDGKLPINPSGGLKSKGHPIGATGVSMHALSAMQLMGEAGDMQIEGATLAGIFNMGGAAVANYTSILERLR